MQRQGPPFLAFVHHAIYYAVEEQFQCAGDIAPIAWCRDDECVGLLYEFQHTLRIVFGQDAFVCRPAFHAAEARTDVELLHGHRLHLHSRLPAFVGHHLHHLRDVAVAARACVQYQYHIPLFISFCLSGDNRDSNSFQKDVPVVAVRVKSFLFCLFVY